MNNLPSPWMGMSVEEMKAVAEHMKAQNQLQTQAQKAADLAKKQQAQQGVDQVQVMKDRLPFLDQ